MLRDKRLAVDLETRLAKHLARRDAVRFAEGVHELLVFSSSIRHDGSLARYALSPQTTQENKRSHCAKHQGTGLGNGHESPKAKIAVRQPAISPAVIAHD